VMEGVFLSLQCQSPRLDIEAANESVIN